ncbi:MAG: agl cluster protein AglQ [Cyanobacteria bacterium P01_C01_bin.120]
MIQLYDIFLRSATAAIDLQDPETGSMPAGHNGSYFDPETPVRNTSHWLITFLHTYSISQEKQFFKAAERAVEYLCSRDARPVSATFWHRKNPNKDACNGLMGQAWTIEALVEAAIKLERPELLKLAEDVFLMHPFNEDVGLWQRVAVDGTYLGFDFTFNHQLWFAAAGSLLASYVKGDVEAQVEQYMNMLPFSLEIYSSGLIRHNNSWKKFKLKSRIARRLRHRYSKQKMQALRHKEIGYHSFNLYAFGLIKSCRSQNSFWGCKKFEKVLRYILSQDYKNQIKDNKYGYPYNPPGFEVAFSLSQFVPNTVEEQGHWIAGQIQRCYDFDKNLMCLATKDPMTGAARLYEATRLSNFKLNLNENPYSAVTHKEN